MNNFDHDILDEKLEPCMGPHTNKEVSECEVETNSFVNETLPKLKQVLQEREVIIFAVIVLTIATLIVLGVNSCFNGLINSEKILSFYKQIEYNISNFEIKI